MESFIFGLTKKLLMWAVAGGDSVLEVEIRMWVPILAWLTGCI